MLALEFARNAAPDIESARNPRTVAGGDSASCVRAEHRVGELLREMEESGKRDRGESNSDLESNLPTSVSRPSNRWHGLMRKFVDQ